MLVFIKKSLKNVEYFMIIMSIVLVFFLELQKKNQAFTVCLVLAFFFNINPLIFFNWKMAKQNVASRSLYLSIYKVKLM